MIKKEYPNQFLLGPYQLWTYNIPYAHRHQAGEIKRRLILIFDRGYDLDELEQDPTLPSHICPYFAFFTSNTNAKSIKPNIFIDGVHLDDFHLKHPSTLNIRDGFLSSKDNTITVEDIEKNGNFIAELSETAINYLLQFSSFIKKWESFKLMSLNDFREHKLQDQKWIQDNIINEQMSLKERNNSKTNIELIDDLIEDIYNLRKESMEEDGEYSIKNLIFKEFRNLGYLDNLKELRKKEISKELSLEQLQEYKDKMDIETLKLLEGLNNDNQLTENVGDVLENQKESYLISSGKNVLVASMKNNKLTPSWVTSQSITKYNQIRFLSADDAQKFNDKYNLEGSIGKARSSYDLVEINLDPTIKTYINKAWFSKIGPNALELAGLKDVKLYSEDILNDLKELFNIFDSKKTKFDLNGISIQVAKNYSVPIRVKNISQLEQNKNKLIDVQKITLNLKYILKNITLNLYIDINNKDNRLNTIDEVFLFANPNNILISGSEEEIKNKTSSIPNISTIIDIGNFLLKEIRKDVDYRSHIQELKELGIDIYKDINGNRFAFENFSFDINFENNSWMIGSYLHSNYNLILIKTSPKEYYMKYPLGNRDDLYSNNSLMDKVEKAEAELNREIKNSNLNLIEFLNKISAYWEKEDNNIDRNKVYECINKYIYDIGQNLLDLAEANLKLEK